MKRRVLIPFVLALLLIAALAPATFAAPSFDTVIEANEVVNNDVVVFDGDLEIRAGAMVNGDVAVFNGDALVDGQINGSLTLFNGDLVAGPDAAVSGECVLLNGEVTSESRVRNCTAVQSFEFDGDWLNQLPVVPGMPELPAMPALPTMPAMPELPAIPADPAVPVRPIVPVVPAPEARLHNTGAVIFGIISSSLLFGVLGLLAGAIMPNQLRQMVTTAREKALVSGAAGALTAVAVPSLIILLIPVSILLTFVCIGLLGFPIMFLLGLALVAGGFLGWIAVGTWLGMRLFGRGKNGDHIVRSAALGTALLTFIVQLLGAISFGIIGGLVAIVVSFIGLGAVALTQFGMKPYPRRPQAGAPGNTPDAGKVDSVLGTLPPEESVA